MQEHGFKFMSSFAEAGQCIHQLKARLVLNTALNWAYESEVCFLQIIE